MKSFMPLFLNLKDKNIVIFGAGNVALRKAKIFSKFSNVIVISKEFNDEFNDLNVLKIKREITKDIVFNYIKEAFITIPATNDYEINKMIAEIMHSQNKLVNRVDDERENDLIVPSIISMEELRIAISTSGKSPMMSKFLREEIENFITEEHLLMLKLQRKLRDYLKENISSQNKREEILRKIIRDRKIWGMLKEGMSEEAFLLAKEKVNKCIQ